MMLLCGVRTVDAYNANDVVVDLLSLDDVAVACG